MTSPLLPGAEPLSVAGGRTGALVLHGFTGTPFVMRPTAERLAAAGLSVELPLLPGHGTAVADMLGVRWHDWADAAERVFADLAARCEKVAVVGFSMGGTLACLLAERHAGAGRVAGVALVNPLVEPPPDDLRRAVRELLDAGTELVPDAGGGGPDVADPDVPPYATYDETPLAAVLSLFKGAEEVALDLDRISCPVLLLSSREDHVVAPSNGDLLAASVAGRCERVWLDRSYHNAMIDYDRQEVEDRIVEFVLSVADGAGAGEGET